MYPKEIASEMFRYWIHLLFPLLVYSLISPNSVTGLFAQDQTPLRLSVDVARFRGDSTHTKLEIYQSIGRQGLTYYEQSKIGFIANFQLDTKIIQKDSVVFQQEIVEADTISDRDKIESGQQFIYVWPFFLKPGRYHILTVLQDKNSGRESAQRIPLDISLFSQDSLVLSDIQFASHIEKASNLNSPFVKNNLHVMPNPRSLYGDGLENLTFYAELYNLDFSNGSGGTYSVNYIIEGAQDKVLNRIRGKQRAKQSKNAAIYTSFDISSLKSSRYILKLDVTDNSTNRHANILKPFAIYRQADAQTLQADAFVSQAEQQRNIYRKFDESAVQNYFDQIFYIATEDEKQIFKQLKLQGKREFLYQFWLQRDPSPGTPENVFKDDYIQRLLQAKIRFASGGTEGWQTDRGRILLIYGAPDFIDREPSLSARNAYEIWSYETLQGVQGQSLFVFIDLNDNGKYRLIHSDYRDEISNPNWESYLYK